MSSGPHPKILVMPPSPLLDEIMSPRAIEVLESLGAVDWNRTRRILTKDVVAERIRGCTPILTSLSQWAQFELVVHLPLGA